MFMCSCERIFSGGGLWHRSEGPAGVGCSWLRSALPPQCRKTPISADREGWGCRASLGQGENSKDEQCPIYTVYTVGAKIIRTLGIFKGSVELASTMPIKRIIAGTTCDRSNLLEHWKWWTGPLKVLNPIEQLWGELENNRLDRSIVHSKAWVAEGMG